MALEPPTCGFYRGRGRFLPGLSPDVSKITAEGAVEAYYHPEGMIAGFHAEHPDPAVPELCAVGEQWTPAGRPMGWHAHEEWEFYFQIDGETLRRDDRRAYELRA